MRTTTRNSGSPRILIQFLLLAAAWGASFLFIKIGLAGLSPTQVVLARMVFGALTLGGIVAYRKRPLPREPVLYGHLTIVALLLCLFPFVLFSFAEQHVSSGVASMLNGATPLMAMLIAAMALREERFTAQRTTGLVLGFLGVVTIVGAWRGIGAGSDLLGLLACLGATVCYGIAFVYLRRFVAGRGLPAVDTAFIQVSSGSVIMLLATPWIAATPVRIDAGIVLSMVALGATGTGLAYIWNNNIIAAWGASNAAAVTYLTPVVGATLGVIVLGEPLTWNQPVGVVLIILGLLAAHGRLNGILTKRLLRGHHAKDIDQRPNQSVS